MANKPDTIGFGTTEKAPKKPRAPKSNVLMMHVYRDLIPGDVCIALETVLKQLEWPYEEVTTVRTNPMSGDVMETPFIRHQVEGGSEIPVGTFRVEGLGDVLADAGLAPRGSIAMMGQLINKSAKDKWKELLAAVAAEAKKTSVFRGRALLMHTPQDLMVPNLLDTSRAVEVIFNRNVEKQLYTCVLWPLSNREQARGVGIRTRRGTLLSGNYGCGKSLFLYNAAKSALEAGWTVINTNPGMIEVAMMVMPLLQPCCIIVEDVDSGTHGDRDRLNGILNSISSAATKSKGDYSLILSTNFLERIEPALLRPERIDAIIEVPLPDAESIERLVRLHSEGKVSDDIHWPSVCDALSGCTPAIIAEVVQRSMIDAEIAGTHVITGQLLIEHVSHMAKQKAMAVPVLKTDKVGDRLARDLYSITEGYIA